MKELLAARRTPIIDEWFARTLESYPPQAARLLAGVTDRFRNPAGHLLRDNLATIFDAALLWDDWRAYWETEQNLSAIPIRLLPNVVLLKRE